MSLLRRALERRGFDVRRTTPRPLRESLSDLPTVLLEQASWLGRSVLVDVPISRCCDVLGARADENPFVAACRDPGRARSTLDAYYTAFHPTTAAGLLGLSPSEAPAFAALPAMAYGFPWDGEDPASAVKNRARWIAEEAHVHGFDLSMDDGTHLFGPVTQTKVDMEVLRLTTLLEGIEEGGYRRSDQPDGDVRGTVLLGADGRWCLHASMGLHRLAAASALGQATLPVRILRAPVTRAAAALWPQVTFGRVTEGGALAVFDRFMRGDHPANAHRESA